MQRRRPLTLWPLRACVLLCVVVLACPARAQSSLDRIRQRGELIIGTDATYPPFEYLENGEFRGFDIDFGNEIGKELGVRVKWVNISWDGIFAALQTGKFDLVISDVVITDKRKESLAFSRPYFLSGQTVVRRKGDARVGSSQDLFGKLIAVQQETTGQYAVEKMGIPTERIRKMETMQDALLDVRNARSDAAVGDYPALKEMIRKGYPELETVGGIFVRENYGVVLRKGEPELLAAVNEAIGRIAADDRYERIYRKWMQEPLPAAYLQDLDAVQSEGTSVADNAGGSAFAIRWDQIRDAFPTCSKGPG